MTLDRGGPSSPVERLVARYVDRHLLDGTRLDPGELCSEEPKHLDLLRAAIASYHALDETLQRGSGVRANAARDATAPLPAFDGFRTIERIGQGGMGDVYKLEDQVLHRVVAGKVIRADRAARTSLADFFREARSLALFQDPRIVQVYEFRADTSPPLLVMEHVDGFPLAQIAPSLELTQRARIVAELAEAMHHAHSLGITHRDLKPGNILLGARLEPKILDFGLASADPLEGHGAGTPQYLAPEQLDPARPIDARTDVHALGLILYEVLCGQRAYDGETQEDVLAAVLAGRARLPCEIDPAVPEPLQAIALKAMEHEPRQRYATARDMAQDLRRWLAGQPVLARPTLYASALEQRVRPHLEDLREWVRLNLVHGHEAEHLEAAYRRLEVREEDWIVQGRTLAFSQIALYLGAFLVAVGGVLYFGAYRVFETIAGASGPILVLGVPFAALTIAAWRLWSGERRAVAIAFHLASLLLLPMLVLLVLSDLHVLPPDAFKVPQAFGDWDISNVQLQLAAGLAACWAAVLAWRTRTMALAIAMTVLVAVTHLAVLLDYQLLDEIDDGAWDRVSLQLLPLLVVLVALGAWTELRERRWLSGPLLVGAAAVLVIASELACLDGKAFQHLGFTLARFQGADVDDPTLIDTLGAMTLAGLLFHVVGAAVERSVSRSLRAAAQVLLVIAPFAVLEPLGYLNETEDYARAFTWGYLVLALAIVVLSRYRQRRAFFHAGVINCGIALVFIADRYKWLDDPPWSALIIVAGLASLAAGMTLHAWERRGRVRGR